jgi:uncharacterized protein with FMN-binding domain
MKKFLLSFAVILAFAFYVFYHRGGEKTIDFGGVFSRLSGKGQYKDGQYTSKVADAFYGPLQIEVIISNGRIFDVKFLQFPNDRPTSVEISNNSLPILKTEAIHSQSSEVEIVSGATQTSEAFQIAMREVLAKAK